MNELFVKGDNQDVFDAGKSIILQYVEDYGIILSRRTSVSFLSLYCCNDFFLLLHDLISILAYSFELFIHELFFFSMPCLYDCCCYCFCCYLLFHLWRLLISRSDRSFSTLFVHFFSFFSCFHLFFLFHLQVQYLKQEQMKCNQHLNLLC